MSENLSIGQEIMEMIVEKNLIGFKSEGDEPIVVVWSSTAAEQIEAAAKRTCKTCKHWKEWKYSRPQFEVQPGECESPMMAGANHQQWKMSAWAREEIQTGPDFGCVNHETK